MKLTSFGGHHLFINQALTNLRILLLILLFNQCLAIGALIQHEEKSVRIPQDSIIYTEASGLQGQKSDGSLSSSMTDKVPQSSSLVKIDKDPMITAASHYHKSGGKGWLDMGAWTKKKGAFGWYADFPVGKGK